MNPTKATHRSLHVLLHALAALPVACGGTVVVDGHADGAGGTGGHGACCDCPQDDVCGSYTCQDCACLLAPAPAGASCPDGYRDSASTCVTLVRLAP